MLREIILLLSRWSASSSCFILLRKSTMMFMNAPLLPLLCFSSSNASSSPLWCSLHSWRCELRSSLVFFSSFFTKVTMLSSRIWYRKYVWMTQSGWNHGNKHLRCAAPQQAAWRRPSTAVQTVNMASRSFLSDRRRGGSGLRWSTLWRIHEELAHISSETLRRCKFVPKLKDQVLWKLKPQGDSNSEGA